MREDVHSLESHVRELRSRLIHSVILFSVLAVVGFLVSGGVLEWLQADLRVGLHALAAYEVIYTQIMIGLIFGLVAGFPVFLYQVLRFAEPGLRPGEYLVLRNFLPFSYLLFLVGGVFAYEFVVKTSFQFFESSTAAASVAAVWGLQNTIGLALKLSIFTGFLYQLPLVCVVLARVGLLSADQMMEYRVYVVVAVLVLAAVVTPPDVVTQVLVTIPVIGLYQLSIFLVSRV